MWVCHQVCWASTPQHPFTLTNHLCRRGRLWNGRFKQPNAPAWRGRHKGGGASPWGEGVGARLCLMRVDLQGQCQSDC